MKRGRKAILTDIQRWGVGGFCEDEWRKLCEKQTFDRHDALPHMKQVREAQQKITRARFKYERQIHSEKIDVAIARARSNHLARIITVRRPYAEAAPILGRAIFWCWQKYKKRISRQYARDCWDSFRECEAAIVRASGQLID
ncbi:hypothetical protein [Bradyrhizobium elkanii]|uniref:hypothetical protein n=1 Tax=Bradyrhizobium elkanii TaxID=29448 RepID=UPI0022275FD9|nr:hypothetical protein [Bradyrhizobium elkanii]MCW2130147.1 hypothetical protein [Bradyrhizobium elkanii]MCW2167824.1 hypothetical protein [Bradyrhizobium elkanii]